MKIKTTLVFNKEARKEYLTGFQKRKQERRVKAKAEKDKALKDEHKRIKAAYKEDLQKQLPRIEDIFSEEVLKDTLKVIDGKTHVTEIEEISLNKSGLEIKKNITEQVREYNQHNNVTTAILPLKKALQMKCKRKTLMKRIKKSKKKIVKVKK